MKTSRITALALTLLTASVGTWAHMTHEHLDAQQPAHPMHMMQGMQGPMSQRMQQQSAMAPADMRALQAEMREKMQSAKTPEERQALMTQQHEKMHGAGHMSGMPGMMSPR
jgi:ABC-type transporter MlaC component